MKILFIHQNFPGQFKYLAPALAGRGHEVRALAITGTSMIGVEVLNYSPTLGSTKGIHPLAIDFETKVIRANACAQAMFRIKDAGFTPDVIVAHPGWGESLLAREVFPNASQLYFLEYFYNSQGGDVGFDWEFEGDVFLGKARAIMKNASVLLSLNQMDYAYAPTQWQKSTFPKIYQDRIDVIFDGVNTEVVAPLPEGQEASTVLQNGTGQKIELKQGQEILTFVNRNLEPYRGYHTFMRALPEIQRRRPDAMTIIVGGDGVSYGAPPDNGKSWKMTFLDEVRDRINLSKVIFLGSIPYDAYLNLLRISRCHVYLTYPFVLSWSCIEAMSMGCAIVGSRTSPVEEVICDGVNGVLVDFFNFEELAKKVTDILADPQKYAQMCEAARRTVLERYDLNSICLPRQISLVENMINKNKQ